MTRNGVLFFVLLLLPIIEASFAERAEAQNTTLYGITSDGKLVQINTSTVSVTQVRTTLPSITGIYSGLTLYNNSFQTFKNANTTSATCDFLSFGPTTSDEIDRGAVHGGCNLSLATSPGGDFETVNELLYINKLAFAIETISLQSLRADPIPNPIYIVHSGNTGDDSAFEGLAYADASTAYEINTYHSSSSYSTHLWKLSKSGGMWHAVSDWFPSVSNGVMGLVVDPSSSTTLYTVSGYSALTQSSFSPSTLYKINMSSGSPVVTTVGTFTGYTITGLTYGPALNQVSSPTSPPNPPPVRPMHMNEKVFEIIREIIFN